MTKVNTFNRGWAITVDGVTTREFKIYNDHAGSFKDFQEFMNTLGRPLEDDEVIDRPDVSKPYGPDNIRILKARREPRT